MDEDEISRLKFSKLERKRKMDDWSDQEIGRLNNVIRKLSEMLEAAGVHPAIIGRVIDEAYKDSSAP